VSEKTFWRICRLCGIALPVILYWVSSQGPSGKELILQKAANEEFIGRADSIYHQTMNHNIKTVRLSDGHNFELWPEWENLVDVGDSIFKKKGRLTVMLCKKKGKDTVLDYEQIVKDFKN
jgi:hypothetical protein